MRVKAFVKRLLGINDNRFFLRNDIIAITSRITKRPAIFFDIEVTDYCNLNCKSCGSYAPLAKKEFINVSDLEKDIKCLAELSGGVCHHINILGGEPLLHPDLLSILEMTRNYFPIGSIILVTNGTLLLKQNEDFWRICRENDIVIAPTIYPIKVDYDAIEKKAIEEKCQFRYYGNASDYWYKTGISEKGNINEAKRFLECSNANNCSVLKNGKIYMCPKPAKVQMLNEHFGTNFKVTDKDYIDIYNASSIDAIMEFLAKPIPFCRYCKEWSKIDWGVSQKSREEWIDE